MEVYTIGFTQRSAASFFGGLRTAGVRRLVDVRLHNVSQLAGYSKRDDLEYFLRELCGAEYIHEPQLAPEADMLDEYRSKRIGWSEYERRFMALMLKRGAERSIDVDAWRGTPTALLCSEPTAQRCHRRLVLEYLAAHGAGWITPVHL